MDKVIETYDDLLKFQESCLTDTNKWIFRADKYDKEEKKLLRTSLEKAFDSIDPLTPPRCQDHFFPYIRCKL